MRQQLRSFGLAVSAAVAVASLVAVTAAQAQMKGGGLSTGPRVSLSPKIHIDASTSGAARPKLNGVGIRANASLRVGSPKGGHQSATRPGRIVNHGVAAGIGAAAAANAAVAASTAVATSATINARDRAATLRNAINIPPPNENRFVKNEVLLEFDGSSPAAIARLLARRGLVQLESQSLTLTNSIVVRARIARRRASVRATLQGGLRKETILRFGQPNYLYFTAQQMSTQDDEPARITPAVATAAAIPAGGDPAQYALGKLRLGQAHTLSTGDTVVVAVIDSAIDVSHPDLAGTIAGSYDALGRPHQPHQHGTAIAGAIAAHARLTGAAPAAKILGIRAFDASGGSAQATSMAILKGIEYAVRQRARVINMSFAGPLDPKLSRALAATKDKGTVLVAASGNLGPNSPPQYPAADPNVIAVSATDANDKIFGAANIGPHIAVAAPGVDILLPSPGNEYRLISGTSFSAAYVSGVVALILQRAPGLTPDQVHDILEKTARDLGPIGKDPEFGAGLVDAYQAILAVQSPRAEADAPRAQ